jgi:hypothetical protein
MHRVHEAASVTQDFHDELGPTYVDPAQARVSRAVLDDPRRCTLEAWVETLVPADEHWPSAAETDAVGYIDATVLAATSLRPILIRGLDQLEAFSHARFSTGFADLSGDNRHDVLQEFEALNPDRVFELVLELTLEAYYRDEHVLSVLERRTGFSIERSMQGWPMESFDLSLLSRVRRLPPRCRKPD